MVKSFKELLNSAQEKGPKKISVAVADDEEVLRSIKAAMNYNMIKPILLGDKSKIYQLSKRISFDTSQAEIINIRDKFEASRRAIQLVRDGKADILMKGSIDTSVIMKEVLDKENGLRTNNLISHGAIFEMDSYHKILFLTDSAMNINPNLEEKRQIIENIIELAYSFKIENPKVAVLAAKEKVSQKMLATIHGEELTNMNRNGQIKGCIVEGPLALDNAISKKAALLKGISSKVAGDADILLLPDINAGNILYKSLNFLAKTKSAGIILGARAPIVLTSRADSEETKLYSIALGVLLAVKYGGRNDQKI